jgi:hypothetical protein
MRAGNQDSAAALVPGFYDIMAVVLSFRDGPKDQTSGAQCAPGNLDIGISVPDTSRFPDVQLHI